MRRAVATGILAQRDVEVPEGRVGEHEDDAGGGADDGVGDDRGQDALAAGVGLHLHVVRERFAAERPYDLDELAEAAEVDRDVVERLFRAANRLHVDDAYGTRDVDYLELVKPLLERLPIEQLERAARLRSRVLSSVVIADMRAAQLDATVREAMESGLEDGALGEVFADAAEVLIPRSAEIIAADYRDQVLRLLDSDVVEQASRDLGRDVWLAVGFVDLVGFTELSAHADPDGVGDVLDAFERLVETTASDVGDVLSTKTIGDAVMLVAGDVDRLARVLAHVVTADDVPELAEVARRAGIATGEVRVRDGDYVGTVVNTAARLTDLAHPGSLVVTHDAWDHLPDDDWDTSLLPPKYLKGLGRSRPLRLRRAAGS